MWFAAWPHSEGHMVTRAAPPSAQGVRIWLGPIYCPAQSVYLKIALRLKNRRRWSLLNMFMSFTFQGYFSIDNTENRKSNFVSHNIRRFQCLHHFTRLEDEPSDDASIASSRRCRPRTIHHIPFWGAYPNIELVRLIVGTNNDRWIRERKLVRIVWRAELLGVMLGYNRSNDDFDLKCLNPSSVRYLWAWSGVEDLKTCLFQALSTNRVFVHRQSLKLTSKDERGLNRLIDTISGELISHIRHLFVFISTKRDSSISSFHLQHNQSYCHHYRSIFIET